jgi:hypothetical protein
MTQPTTVARQKRQAGEPLSDEDRQLLADRDRQYLQLQLKITLQKNELLELRRQAKERGQRPATLAAGFVRLGMQGGVISEETYGHLEKEMARLSESRDQIQLQNAQLQINLSEAQKMVRDYQAKLAGLAQSGVIP